MTAPPAPDALAMLAELVACKDLHDEIEKLDDPMNWKDPPGLQEKKDEYDRRKPLAWAAARAALTRDQGEVALTEKQMRQLVLRGHNENEMRAGRPLSGIDRANNIEWLKSTMRDPANWTKEGHAKYVYSVMKALDELRAPAEGEVAALREAAQAVVWFDWSDNDDDAVAAIQRLRDAVDRLAQPPPEGK